MAKEDDVINVYWAPYTSTTKSGGLGEWNMFYEDPKNLFEEVAKDKLPSAGYGTMLSCPSVTGLMKKIYVFNNTIDCSFEFTRYEAKPLSENYVVLLQKREPTMKQGPSFEYGMIYMVFADQPLTARWTQPYYHRTTYASAGAMVPGEFDVGQWFRPLNLEIQMFNDKGTVHFEKNTPLAYLEFQTDKKINLHRFKMTEDLLNISDSQVTAPGTFGRRLPLAERYKRFNATKQNKIVLKLIKENLVD
jgi:hypothetical protein